MICRHSDHTVGRPRAENRTRAGRPRGRDTTPRPPHLPKTNFMYQFMIYLNFSKKKKIVPPNGLIRIHVINSDSDKIMRIRISATSIHLQRLPEFHGEAAGSLLHQAQRRFVDQLIGSGNNNPLLSTGESNSPQILQLFVCGSQCCGSDPKNVIKQEIKLKG